ncbi:MAG: glycosyltransferase family 4 protein [Terriglobales bacterium]
MRVLCVLGCLLGNRVFADRVHEALARYPELEPTFVELAPQDYQRHAVPFWCRWSDAWHVEAIMRRKLEPHRGEHWDAALVSGWESVLACAALARSVPTAAEFDFVPAAHYRQLRRRGVGGLHRAVLFAIHHRRFAAAVPRIRAFLPRGSECARSLLRDYHVPASNFHTTLAAQHLEVWTPNPDKSWTGPLRLLFVGNDFSRKGGPLLLAAFAQSLHKLATLTIVSNDAALASAPLPPGVTWLRGKDKQQLLEVFRSSDLFVFPTQQDSVAEVIGEAITAGLPCIASDVGSISDLVIDGENGCLMPPGAPAAAWIEKITSLAGRRPDLARMGARSREIAEEKLDFESFAALLAGTLTAIARTPPGSAT